MTIPLPCGECVRLHEQRRTLSKYLTRNHIFSEVSGTKNKPETLVSWRKTVKVQETFDLIVALRRTSTRSRRRCAACALWSAPAHQPPETRNPKPEARNPRPETRDPKPETRDPKPETRN